MSVATHNHAVTDFREVLQPSPFQTRIDEQCLVQDWMSWNGYKTARVFDTLASEYFAIRSTCSVMDLTPMEKYRITGPDASAFLNRLVTRDISALKPQRVTYVIWCNDEGKVLDDGTIFHLSEGDYRLCSQHHQLDWLLLSSLGFDVNIEQETHNIAALAVQGPTSCSVLTAAGVAGVEQLKPFDIGYSTLNGIDVMVSRTGFTGDLGYEVWADPTKSLAVWDAIFAVKENGLFDIRPMGLGALDMVRIEAGFIMPGDDFNTAETAVRADRDRSPFELGLGWLVNFDKPYFTGKKALLAESKKPAKRRLVRLSVEGNKSPTDAFLYDEKGGSRIGTIKSCVWSPILKTNVSLADVEFVKGEPPANIWAEIYYQKELEWRATWAKCTISAKPFWTHPRSSVTPPNKF
ncbi:aminomethyltransferase family protein [Gammaproteobacteria bacterium]|nr:aminomethyltransferase family protein [Gammaproteobacteria bacterium]